MKYSIYEVDECASIEGPFSLCDDNDRKLLFLGTREQCARVRDLLMGSPRCSCWTAQPQPDEPDTLGEIGVLLLEFAEADHRFDHPEETDEVAVLAERWERALDPIRQVAYRIRQSVQTKTRAQCIADLANALRLTPEEEEMGQ